MARKKNPTLKEWKQIAVDFKGDVGFCLQCNQPFVWKKGYYTVPPETCGRDKCEVTNGKR